MQLSILPHTSGAFLFKMTSKKKKYIAVFSTLVVILLAFIFFTRDSKSSNANGSLQTNTGSAKKSATINKEFEFPIKDDKDNEITKFKYTIESAEVRDEIVVKGQKVTSVSDRTFLIINIKIINTLDKMVQINTRDYIRLIRNSNPSEQLAPDVHNDPVEVQAISTKLTRVAFPINNTDTDLQLQIGEIIGEKQIIPIPFQ
jgi:hypothetical protein